MEPVRIAFDCSFSDLDGDVEITRCTKRSDFEYWLYLAEPADMPSIRRCRLRGSVTAGAQDHSLPQSMLAVEAMREFGEGRPPSIFHSYNDFSFDHA